MRPRGGIIGATAQPAASAFNSAAGGIWTLREAEAFKRAGTWPSVPPEPYWLSVSLLLPFDGTNNSNTFTDFSESPKTLSGSGDAKLSTAVKKFGTASLALDGTGDILTSTSNGYTFGTDDFTVECWVYSTEAIATADNGVFQIGNSLSNPNMTGIAMALNSGVPVIYSGGLQHNGSTAPVINTWHHMAMARSGTTLKMFLDGVEQVSVTNSSNLTANQLMLGAYYNTQYPWQGYIDEFRITKGVARYATAFTPPTASFERP